MIVRHSTYRYGVPSTEDNHCTSAMMEAVDLLVLYGVPLEPAVLGENYIYPESAVPLGSRLITVVNGDTFLMFPCGSECVTHKGSAVYYETCI